METLSDDRPNRPDRLNRLKIFLKRLGRSGRSYGNQALGVMIFCGTGKIPFHDNGYGYYCGLGGKGKPVDDTDQ